MVVDQQLAGAAAAQRLLQATGAAETVHVQADDQVARGHGALRLLQGHGGLQPAVRGQQEAQVLRHRIGQQQRGALPAAAPEILQHGHAAAQRIPVRVRVDGDADVLRLGEKRLQVPDIKYFGHSRMCQKNFCKFNKNIAFDKSNS